MVTVRVCSKLQQAESWLFLQIKSGRILEFVGVFNITIIPLALVRYEMIIDKAPRRLSTISYPTRTRGVIVKYTCTTAVYGFSIAMLFTSLHYNFNCM